MQKMTLSSIENFGIANANAQCEQTLRPKLFVGIPNFIRPKIKIEKIFILL